MAFLENLNFNSAAFVKDGIILAFQGWTHIASVLWILISDEKNIFDK